MKAPQGLIQKPDSLFTVWRKQVWRVILALKNNPHFYQFLLSVFVLVLFIIFLPSARFQRMENIVHDTFFKQRKLATHPDIVLIEIAEDSLESIGRWPWPRSYHAALTHILSEWGAKAVVFDIIFSEPSTDKDDQAFKEALAEKKIGYFATVLEPHGNKKEWIRPLPAFAVSGNEGHINIEPDSDGTLRRIKPYIKEGSQGFPHIALKVAYDYLGKKIDFEKEKPFPLDRNGNLLVNWAGKWQQTFKHYSYVDILVSYQEMQSGKKGTLTPEDFKGKICIIGLTATGLADIKANPVEAAYPASGIHANLISSVLTNQFLKQTSNRSHAIALIVIGMVSLLFFIPFRGAISLVFGIVVGIGWFLTSLFLFMKKGIIIFAIQPILLIAILFIFSAVFAFIIANKERFHFFQLATRDGLTGLYVIRHFKIILAEAIVKARKVSEPLAVILIDIDNFKKVNDTYGHQAGDMILRGTAQNVESSVRYKRSTKDMDYVARYGGEEIIVLLRKSNLTDAAFKVAERIRATVEQTKYESEGQTISPTISLGVSSLQPGDTIDSLIRRADEALYRAKKQGKNRVCVEGGLSVETEVKADHG